MKKQIEHRLRRLAGMTPEQLDAMHKAAGSTMWWARCWNCKKTTAFKRDLLDHTNCQHCGVNMSERPHG